MNLTTINYAGFGLAILAILLSTVALTGLSSNDNDDSSQVTLNTEGIITINENIEQVNALLQSNIQDRLTTEDEISKSITNIKKLHSLEINELERKVQQLEARTTQQEQATRTTNANQLDVPIQTTPILGFGLMTLDRGGVQVGAYQINDVIYLSIHAGASVEPKLLVELRSEDGGFIWGDEYSVVDRFTVKYGIPAGLSAGTYSLTVSDGTIASSINFDIAVI